MYRSFAPLREQEETHGLRLQRGHVVNNHVLHSVAVTADDIALFALDFAIFRGLDGKHESQEECSRSAVLLL